MNRPSSSFSAAAVVAAIGILCGPAPAVRAADDGDRVEQARSLYAQGRYAEARPLLEAIDTSGQASGTMLYRLAYCQRALGEAAGAAETQRRARELLETELATTDDLEVPFYLVNTYQNLGRHEDARRVAAETTERVEQGDLPSPRNGIEMFQLGKLYADQGGEERASEWYAKALERLPAEDAGGSYVSWAARHLAEASFKREDFGAAAKYYTTLIESGDTGPGDLERLAVSRTRVGQYKAAADAWKQAERAQPSNADRARYCHRLNVMAARLETLPPASPSGRPWTALSKEELEATMKEQSEQFKKIVAEFTLQREEHGMDRPQRRVYAKRAAAARAIFVSAGLEYTLRGHDIRQTAFFGGYAPLILKPTGWRMPRAEPDATAKAND